MGHSKSTLSVLPGSFAVCKLEPENNVPKWARRSAFWSVTKTQHELSIVCSEDSVPEDVEAERGWKVLEVEGPLDFGATGVLNGLTTPLAESKISVLVSSTYLTDYLFIRDKDLKSAMVALGAQGYKINCETE